MFISRAEVRRFSEALKHLSDTQLNALMFNLLAKSHVDENKVHLIEAELFLRQQNKENTR